MAKKRAGGKRARNEGSVYQRDDGLWIGSVTTGYKTVEKDGVPKRVQVRRTVSGHTQAEALGKLRKLQGRVAAGRGDTDDKLTLGDYLTSTWLPAIKPAVAPRTYEPYESHVRVHIEPRIGHMALAKLRPVNIQTFYEELEAAGVSAAMRKKIGTTLGAALAYAVLPLRLIEFNPARGVKKARAEPQEFHPLTPVQLGKFLHEAKEDRLYPYYLFALDSGAGPGECFALHWPDVNFDTGMVSIRHSLEDKGGHLRLKEPKRDSRRRHVRLSAHTLAVLHEHRKAALALGRDVKAGPVFFDTEGGYLRKGNTLARSFKGILERAGLPRIRLYDLRHTCATLLLLANVPAKVVSERLGHASVTLTLNTYSHVLPDMQKQAAEALHGVLSQIWSPDTLPREGQEGGGPVADRVAEPG